MSMLRGALPHLDSVVSALVPVYLPEIPFRCASAVDRGTRPFVEHARDRDCRWRFVSMVRAPTAGMVPIFRSRYALDLYIEVRADLEDARNVGAELARGIIESSVGADWRGTVAVTTMQAVADAQEPIETAEVVTAEGMPIGVIVSIFFDIQHGSC